MKHKLAHESSQAPSAPSVTFSEKRKFNPVFTPAFISLEESAGNLPFYPAEAEQELRLPHFEHLFTNPAYLNEIARRGGLSQLTDDLDDDFILEAANRALKFILLRKIVSLRLLSSVAGIQQLEIGASTRRHGIQALLSEKDLADPPEMAKITGRAEAAEARPQDQRGNPYTSK